MSALSNFVVYNLVIFVKDEVKVEVNDEVENHAILSEEFVNEPMASSSLHPSFPKEINGTQKIEQSVEKTMVLPIPPINMHGKIMRIPPDKRLKEALHLPVRVNSRRRCAFCSTETKQTRSPIICKVCNVGLCTTVKRNCFELFHSTK